jgi:hypothetical protein
MEAVMTDYSNFLVLFLFVPVLMQIVCPLIMLVAFGLFRAAQGVLGQQKTIDESQYATRKGQELQLSNP